MQFRHTYLDANSVAMTLATLYWLDDDMEQAMFYAGLIKDFLSVISENDSIEAAWLSKTRAHLYALNGNGEEAIEELGKAIDMGERDFRIFMHPAFNELRNNPGYITLMERWLGLINMEREKLGLDPVHLNYAAGPGVIPFELDL